MRKLMLSVSAVFVLSTLASAAGRGPSTAEERQRFLTLTHNLEQAPLQESLYADRAWAYKWLNDIPDMAVDVCTDGLGNFTKQRYQYMKEIEYQLVYSTAAFMIEHPDEAKSLGSLHNAGVGGALIAYNSILKIKPEAKSAALDDLLQRQQKGTLGVYVSEATKSCH
jgi:hypothetical protein